MSHSAILTVKERLKKSSWFKFWFAFKSKRQRALQRQRMELFYSQFVKAGSLCYDVGANEGSRTEVFRNIGARVVAVEPQKSCLHTLHQRFDGDPHVIIVPLGLADAPGQAKLALSADSSTIASLSPEFRQKWRWAGKVHWETDELIELTTLDELIREFGVPDFCKIDVEGFEEQVLLGLSQPVRALSFEFNIEFLKQTRKCLQRLQELTYSRFNYSLGESMVMALKDWSSADDMLASLEANADPLCWGDVYAKR